MALAGKDSLKNLSSATAPRDSGTIVNQATPISLMLRMDELFSFIRAITIKAKRGIYPKQRFSGMKRPYLKNK
jgi:hypothetical protein